MDLNAPLASLLSPLEASAMAVLARADTDFTGRQVARLAGGQNPNGIRLALLRLADTGLVNVRPELHSTRYRANRDHLLWPAIQVALKIETELERRIAMFVEGAGVPGITVAVYGSVARREATAASDLDLLVILPDGMDAGAQDGFNLRLAELVTIWTGNETQVYSLSVSALRSQFHAHDPIVDHWLIDARTIVGSTVRELIS
jgi:predicted nucleotidyltransferase